MLPPGLGFNAVRTRRSPPSKTRKADALVLGLGGDAGDRTDRLLPLHAGDQPAVTGCARR